MNQHRPALTILFYLVCVGIVYGSLFPFEFVLRPERAIVDQFLVSWRTASSKGDILGNIALFVPFGLLAHVLATLPGSARRSIRYFVWVWVLVAAGSQLVQFFVPSRDPSIFDLYCNAAGTVLGWAALRFIPAKTASGLLNVNLPQQISLLLPLLWLASELIPFVPTIDFQAYKDALKPLFLYHHWLWYDALMQASSWLVCFYLLQRYSSVHLPLRRLLPGMIAVVLLKIIIVKNSVSVTDLVAMASALLVWIPLSKRELQPRTMAYVLLFSVLVSSLLPFFPGVEPVAFGWIPFSGFLQGSMLTNATALCEKLFVFGALAFLTQQTGGGWKPRSLLIAVVLLLVEVVQVWVASGTPELTDPVLFLVVAWFYSRVHLQEGAKSKGVPADTGRGEAKASVDGVQVREVAASAPGLSTAVANAAQLLQHAPPDEASHERPLKHSAGARKDSRKRLALIVAAYCALVVILLRGLLALPGVPYNVLELFRFDASGVDLLFFSLTLLSIGWGGAWLGNVLATTTRPLRAISAALIKLAFIIYFLLWMSVTRESIMDISGSSVLVHRVTEKGVLGDFGVQVIALLGAGNVHAVSSIFEPILRFGALIWPLLIFCGLCFWVLKPVGIVFDGAAASGRKLASAGILLALWLYMSKVLAFDWSSTDNLNELVAPDGAWGVGGGGYLYLLILLFSAMGALVTWGYFRSTKALLITFSIAMLSMSVSWLLINNGLGKDVSKYGSNFSGVDFLLGPDRRNLISESQLMLRWAALHTIIVMGLAFSASLYCFWARSTGAASVALDLPKTMPANASEFRVYKEHWTFLENLAGVTGLPVARLVLDIFAYFDGEISSSPQNRQLVQHYVNQGGRAGSVDFSPRIIQVELSPEALTLVSALDPGNMYSASKVFRRLLTLFIAVSDESASS